MGKKPTWTDQQLIETIPKCRSFTEVCIALNYSKSTNSLFKRRANELGIDYSHFRVSGFDPKPLDEVLIYADKLISCTHDLKLRLIRENYFEHKCYKCGITEWNGQPAPIELEHINGDRYDNRIENLTILCPNCHAQTETYRAKNIRFKKVKLN